MEPFWDRKYKTGLSYQRLHDKKINFLKNENMQFFKLKTKGTYKSVVF